MQPVSYDSAFLGLTQAVRCPKFCVNNSNRDSYIWDRGGEKVDKDKQKAKKEEIYRILALSVRKLFQCSELDFCQLQEIRLRIGEPLLVVCHGRELFMSLHGGFTEDRSQAYLVEKKDVRETMEYISNYSMYAFEEELRQGFITVRGGHRVGVAGKLILEGGRIKNMRHISFLNIRLAHEIIGCADSVLPYLLQGGRLLHTLIISPPRCGKTTLLRDLIRQLSNGDGHFNGMTVGVVDERSELGACYLGVPQNDLGCRTDLLDGCPKVQGMMMLVRSMAPQIIAVDEVGSREDVEAMEYVMDSGIQLLATVHGSSIDEVKNKPVLERLIRERRFKRYVVLKENQIGCIESIFDERGTILFPGNHLERLTGLEAC